MSMFCKVKNDAKMRQKYFNVPSFQTPQPLRLSLMYSFYKTGVTAVDLEMVQKQFNVPYFFLSLFFSPQPRFYHPFPQQHPSLFKTHTTSTSHHQTQSTHPSPPFVSLLPAPTFHCCYGYNDINSRSVASLQTLATAPFSAAL